MKGMFALLAGAGLIAFAFAEGKAHRVVFEVTSDNTDSWQAALNNVENLSRALGSVEIEVVAHGKGLGMLLKSNVAAAERIRRLHGSGVVFAACRNTMERMKITPAALNEAAVQVDSGVAEVVRKQEAGWSYLKAGS